MKRTISLLLCTLLTALMIVPSFAADEAKTDFELSEIIENYKPHTDEELAAFKAELSEKEMLWELIYPDVLANVYAVSNHETLRTVPRGSFDVFGDETVIMGIIKDNGFVTIPYSEESDIYFGTGLYGDAEGQYCRLLFSDDALEFLNSMPYDKRETFMLNFYLSVMDTEEAIGLICDRRYFGGTAGDVNGDNKINAADSRALVGFLAGKSSGIVPGNCDMDQNGSINFKDNFYIKKAIIGG